MGVFFRIIVPNYNNLEWLDKCINSVLNQTFKDYTLIIVDDCSTDGSQEYLEQFNKQALVFNCTEKHYNGGSRNLGLKQLEGQSKYTLFLDSDDWLVDNTVLQDLHDFIIERGKPECIRLPYKFEYDGNKSGQVPLNDDLPQKLVDSCFVACWTKCIRSDLVVPFPENTLMEDVVQHIAQCDVISEVIPYNKFVVLHNRNNKNSITAKDNQDLTRGKWRSSMYRYMADLLDLELEKEYCKRQRDIRADACQRNIERGIYSQSIIK